MSARETAELLKQLLEEEGLSDPLVLGSVQRCTLDGQFNLERVAERLLQLLPD